MKQKRLFSIVSAAVLAVIAFSCVDIPTNGPSIDQFNQRSVVRYIHFARGTDTVSTLLAIVNDTLSMAIDISSSTSIDTQIVDRSTIFMIRKDTVFVRDTVSVHDTIRVALTKKYYLRRLVSFDSSLEIRVDGNYLTTLSFGDHTPYYDSPAGNRKISLYTKGLPLDTFKSFQYDSLHSVRKKSIVNGISVERKQPKTFRKNYSIVAVNTPTVGMFLADTISPSISVPPDGKLSVFLMQTKKPVETGEAGDVHFGYVTYGRFYERYDDRIIN